MAKAQVDVLGIANESASHVYCVTVTIVPLYRLLGRAKRRSDRIIRMLHGSQSAGWFAAAFGRGGGLRILPHLHQKSVRIRPTSTAGCAVFAFFDRRSC